MSIADFKPNKLKMCEPFKVIKFEGEILCIIDHKSEYSGAKAVIVRKPRFYNVLGWRVRLDTEEFDITDEVEECLRKEQENGKTEI